MNKRDLITLIINILVVLTLLVYACKNIKIVAHAEPEPKVITSIHVPETECEMSPVILAGNSKQVVPESEPIVKETEVQKSENIMVPTGLKLSDSDRYLLAKIVMAESEGETKKNKGFGSYGYIKSG